MSATAPRRRGLRIALAVLGVVIVLPAAAIGVALATFNPDAYRPQVIDAVRRATGRELTIGALHVKLALAPTLQADDVSFANMPGGSRPQMAVVRQVQARVALLPLLHRQVVIDSLVLQQPDILLETDAAGRGNWQMAPPPQPAAPAASPHAASQPFTIAVRGASIVGGTITWHNGRTGFTRTVAVPSLTASEDAADAPLSLEADLVDAGRALHVTARTGSLVRLRDPQAASPWPVKLSLQAAGASASIDGTLRDPLDGTGYVLDVNATVPALETLQPFSPGPRLPPLHDLSLAAHVADGVPLLQRVTQLKLHIGASDLGTVAPGLQLAALDASAPALDQAVQITGAGSIAGKPLKLDAHLGAPSLALVHQPVTLDITAQAGGATGSVKGSLTRATTLPDIDAVVALRVPDMTELASLTHRRLPALTSVAFDGHVSGTTKQLALSGFKLTTAQGDLADDLTLGLGDTRSLRGSVTATRIDVDALRAALALPPLPDAAPAGPPPVPPLPVHKRGDHWLIPDTPLPLDSLRATDADLTAKIGTLHEAGVDVRDLGFHLVLSDGRLVLDPFAAQLPGGRMSGSLSLDASQPDPPVALHVHAPGIAMQTLLAALGVPPAVSGAMDIDADLKGAGRTPHAMAAVADGTIGLSMQGGRVDNALLGGAFADLLRAANIGQKISGSSELRCFAFRAALSHGRATVQTLLVDSPELHIEGGGTINLADESLALDLRPLAKIGGNGIAIPVHVAGSLRDPKAQIDAGAVAGAIDHGGGFRAIIGALSQEATTEACAPALAVARGQAPPERAPAAPATAGGKLPKPADLLRQLFR